MTLRIILFLFLIEIASLSYGQLSLQKMCQQVLTKEKLDSPYSFKKSTKVDGHSEIILKYLGIIKTIDGRLFKVLTYEFIWGPNFHTSASIYIFNNKNQYVGQYYLGGAVDLPIQLKNDSLMFTNDDNDSCDKNLSTVISLRKGLPKKIFIKCKGVYGDLYSFSSED